MCCNNIPPPIIVSSGIGYFIGALTGEAYAYYVIDATGSKYLTSSIVAGIFGAIGSYITCKSDDLF